ncbi:MAG: aminotransferase class III-fold pyridoxal phosphate-dependent enzyme, partial [Alphaproteobacteria bacterium]|nr:aminotransferase class III-fold pyridoxal phosphate-dependent enzyme [Alphaproteobacteria bacterium]
MSSSSSFRPNSLEARDIESLVHPYTNLSRHRETGPHVIERGKGIYVYDTDGRALIEGMSGLWCTALGYGEEELIRAATQQMEKLSFSHLFGHKSHEPAVELAEMLKARAPVPFSSHESSKVLFMNSGSEANDAAIKLIWYYNNAIGRPEKKKIIARDRAYHGITVASASLTMLPANQNDWDLPIPGFLRTRCPHAYREAQADETEEAFAARLADELEELILAEGPETIAAMFAEPVQGAGGVIIPPEGYFPAIQNVLKKYDILLVADEVITGFCRTGNYWGSQSLGAKPDILTCAKALSSAYLPIGALLIPDFIEDALISQSEKLGTFGH